MEEEGEREGEGGLVTSAEEAKPSSSFNVIDQRVERLSRVESNTNKVQTPALRAPALNNSRGVLFYAPAPCDPIRQNTGQNAMGLGLCRGRKL